MCYFIVFIMVLQVVVCNKRDNGVVRRHSGRAPLTAGARPSRRMAGRSPASAARYADLLQPAGLSTRLVDAGSLASIAAGRRGLTTSSPPQFGHCPPSTPSAHATQNVHSYVQIRASVESGGKSRSQHSQFGLNSNIVEALLKSGKNPATGSPNRAPHQPTLFGI